MRTAIAATFAAILVVALAYVGWRAVDQRLQPDDETAGVAMDAVVAALAAGPGGDPAAVARSGGDDLSAAVDAFASGLNIEDWEVDRGAVEIDGAIATAPLTVTLATEEFGEISWESSVRATRVRGEWGVDVSASTLHPDMEPEHRVVVERTDVTRAPIVDRDGDALTSHGAARSIGVAPERIVNEDRLRQTWGDVLPESYEDLDELLSRSDIQPTWYYPLITVSEARYEEVWTRLRGVPGVVARDAEDATPSGGDFANHVLGRVGQPTAEQAEDLGVPADSVVGLHGLERLFEDELVGSAEARALIVDGDGDTVTELATAQEDPSGPVATTLDQAVQEAVENALSGVSDAAALVVVDASDGAIRASASRPIGGYNRAWEGNYPPGDAFLPVTAEVLLAGDVILRDPAFCPEREAVVGAAFDAPNPLEDTTVGEALAAGCDPTLAELASDLEPDELVAAAERFGFGVEYELPLPSATAEIPTPVDTTELVRAAAGQARVLASPLHMATVVAAAAEGTWYAPYLLRDDEADGRESAELSATALEDLQQLLERGATETGSAAGFAGLGAGGFVGTAPVTGAETEHAWAVGVVDGLGFAVLVEDTDGDTTLVRRIAEQFLRELAALSG